jgi:DNA modification methylase
MEINKLKPNENNPRIIKNDKFKKLVKSIKGFPEMLELRPIVIDEGNVILGGNMRYRACVEAGLKDVPVKVAKGLTEEQKKEFIVKDNVGFGEWEWDMLGNEWDSVELAEWGLDVWENIDDKEPEAGLIEDDEIPEVKESKVKRGDIWQLGEHRVMCGDATIKADTEALMGGEKADMVFTDPPWNVNYGADDKHPSWKPRTILNDKMGTVDFKEFMSSSFSNMSLISKDGCPTYIVMSAQEWGNLMLALKDNQYHWSSTIIWNKDHLVLSRKDYHTKYEPIWYGWKEGATRLCPLKDRKQSDVWDVKRPIRSPLHPTTKPIDLIEIAINNSSIRDSIVLDLFLGSGSTLIAAEKLKRKCYGMELDEKYCDVIIERWEQFTGLKAIKIN